MRRTRSRNALLVTNEDSGLHRRRRLDKLVCLSVSTHASMNTYGVAAWREGREEGRGIGSGADKANGAKSQKNNRP